MPAVSEAQRKAMFAAASGNSTLGISKSVGKEFADADQGGKLPQRAKKRKSAPSKDDEAISDKLTSRLERKDRR